jgi:hypothetical protein
MVSITIGGIEFVKNGGRLYMLKPLLNTQNAYTRSVAKTQIVATKIRFMTTPPSKEKS